MGLLPPQFGSRGPLQVLPLRSKCQAIRPAGAIRSASSVPADSNLAREAGRLYQSKEKFWGRRYQAIVVSNEVEAQISRLAYLLSHGAKKGLVERPQEWPGAHSVTALLTGEPLEGLWFNRTKEYAARRRGEDFGDRESASGEFRSVLD